MSKLTPYESPSLAAAILQTDAPENEIGRLFDLAERIVEEAERRQAIRLARQKQGNSTRQPIYIPEPDMR